LSASACHLVFAPNGLVRIAAQDKRMPAIYPNFDPTNGRN
jgi:hypothetical protein